MDDNLEHMSSDWGGSEKGHVIYNTPAHTYSSFSSSAQLCAMQPPTNLSYYSKFQATLPPQPLSMSVSTHNPLTPYPGAPSHSPATNYLIDDHGQCVSPPKHGTNSQPRSNFHLETMVVKLWHVTAAEVVRATRGGKKRANNKKG